MRIAKVERKTKETEVKVSLNLDGSGKTKIDTGIGSFDSFLQCFAVSGSFDLDIQASGDLTTGTHHMIEDVAICLGKAFLKAIGGKKGIGFSIVPVYDSIAVVAVNLDSPYFVKDFDLTSEIENIEPNNIEHFLQSFALNAEITLNIMAKGKNNHNKCLSIFKALGISMKNAIS
ncbi:MAG: imidazoleglycerol-phosphate dehydratase [Candidatus Hydrothermarchaeota archaeon]